MNSPYNEALGATLIERTKRERIVLVGVTRPGHTDDDTEAGLNELSLLIDTAGADEAGRIVQRRDSPDHTWYIGKGKVEELRDLCLAVDADTVVFDNELSPAQQYNLEKVLGRTALDRTAVIREALVAFIERESARRLARLGGSQPDAAAAPRRRPVRA